MKWADAASDVGIHVADGSTDSGIKIASVSAADEVGEINSSHALVGSNVVDADVASVGARGRVHRALVLILAGSSKISKIADVASAGSAELVVGDEASSSILANIVLTKSVRIWVGSVSAFMSSNEVDAERAGWAVVSTNGAVVGVGTGV